MYLPVRNKTKIPELVFSQIKESILNGEMRSGDKLPPERELVEQFDASRIAIREGLKSLETAGLVVIKPGSGVFVNEVSSKQLSESLSTILRYRKMPFRELTEARIVFEPEVARLAAERITPEDIRNLNDKIKESSDLLIPDSTSASEKRIALNSEIHSIIAESTHNTIISLTMRTFFDVLKELTFGMTENLKQRFEISRFAVKDHRDILQALKSRNSELAYKFMLKHVIHIQEVYNTMRNDKRKTTKN